MRITGLPFILGAWLPYWFQWWDSGPQFAISATIVITILMVFRVVDPL